VLTAAALVVAGAVWMLAVALFISACSSRRRAGRGPLARGIPGFHCRRHRDRQLGLGTSHRHRRRGDALLVSSGLMFLSPLLGRGYGCRVGARQRGGLRSARRSRGATVADRPQRPLVVEIEYRVAQENAAPFTM